MNKVKHLFLVLLLVMAHLQLSATNIELSWSFNQGDAKALQGTVSEEGLFSYATSSLGSDLEFLGTNKAGSLTVTKVQPKVKASNNGDGNAISFSLKTKKGLSLSVKSFSFDACKLGTNGGSIDVVAEAGGKSYELLKDESPQNAKNDPYFTHYKADLSQIPATEGEWVIKVFVKNVAINKQYGFANFAIAATTEGKVEQVNSYSLSASLAMQRLAASRFRQQAISLTREPALR